jgi:hypothetical protein
MTDRPTTDRQHWRGYPEVHPEIPNSDMTTAAADDLDLRHCGSFWTVAQIPYFTS